MAKKKAGKKPSKRKVREIEAEAAPADLAVPVPRALHALLGQPRAREVLEASLRSGRVHHAWIFHGPEGVGKLTAALGFAALLLDPTAGEQPDGWFGADEASECRGLLRAGAHPDLHVVRKELARYSRVPEIRTRKLTTIPVEVLRQYLLEPAYLASQTGGGRVGKVFIVDEAELIDLTGQNLLLKTLEEPPVGTVIILVTSRPDRLLPTIRSRSQRVAFGPLDEGAMRAWLDRASEEVEGLAGAEASVLALAGGSPGLALMALQTGMGGWPAEVEGELGVIDAGRARMNAGVRLAKLIDDWAKGWVDSHAGASKDAANKAGAGHMLRLIAEWYRERLRTAGEESELERLARAIECVREAEGQLATNVQVVFVLEDLFARLATLRAEGAEAV